MSNEYPAIILVIQILGKWRMLLPYILYPAPISFTLYLFNILLMELIWPWFPMCSTPIYFIANKQACPNVIDISILEQSWKQGMGVTRAKFSGVACCSLKSANPVYLPSSIWACSLPPFFLYKARLAGTRLYNMLFLNTKPLLASPPLYIVTFQFFVQFLLLVFLPSVSIGRLQFFLIAIMGCYY